MHIFKLSKQTKTEKSHLQEVKLYESEFNIERKGFAGGSKKSRGNMY